jgi:serine/threonine-protein kinase
MLRRFVEEAQIGGRLQHPGIVPVYELGAFPDRRAFFAMKLVQGRTLAKLLAERKATHQEAAGRTKSRVGQRSATHQEAAGRNGKRETTITASGSPSGESGGLRSADPPYGSDLPRFLGIFEQVCQTMAYAHARGVIHRDLKPSNIMVGSFGEVQVMDWGLAKVLKQGGAADDAAATRTASGGVRTVRSGSAGDESRAGSVLGTPGYMAPEQARGELETLDERSDVFSLGAILCEILTGAPPYEGLDRKDVCTRAAAGDVSRAFERLANCGTDCELVELARRCLSPEPANRPHDAGEVARDLGSYTAGVQDRMRRAELTSVEERARQRLTTVVAASLLVVSTACGLGFTSWLQQSHAGKTRVALALNEATLLGDQARDNPKTPPAGPPRSRA